MDKITFLKVIASFLGTSGDGSVDCDGESTGSGDSNNSGEVSESSCKQVLIIDDNDQAANSLAALLSFDNHQIRIATTAADGIESAISMNPDVVLLDLGLPDMSGFKVLEALKLERKLIKTKFIAVTGEADSAEITQAGFDAHIIKPVDMDRLNETIVQLLS